MKFPEEIIKMNIRANLGKILKLVNVKEYPTEILAEDRDTMLKQMGVGQPIKKIPIIIQNGTGSWINPYFVAKMFLQKGIPKEVSIVLVAKELKMDDPEKWWDGKIEGEGWNWSYNNMPGWCDFWFESFKRIPHNILCDSKEYYKAMNL